MEEEIELPTEPGLLETDIAEGSYNFVKQSTRNSHDEQKLIFRSGHEKGELQFSLPISALESCKIRCECPKCFKKSMYYCSHCRIPLPCTKSVIPCVKLAVRIDIVKDRRELDSKVREALLL